MRNRLGWSLGLVAAALLSAHVGEAQTAQYGLIVNAFAGGATTVCTAATDAVGDGCPALQSTMVTPYIGSSDSVGNYYVSDQGTAANTARVRKVDVRSGIITTVAGGATTVCAAATNAIGDGCPATQATLATVRSTVFDAAGDMYIADTSDSVVRYVDAKTGIITSVAGTGAAGTATTVFSSTTPIAASSAKLGNVIGMQLDKAGNLYLSFSNQYQVLVLLAVNGKVTGSSLLYSIAGTGVKGFMDGAGSVAQFNSARGLGIDLAGNLYLADDSNNRVRKITSPFVAGVLSIGSVVVSTVAGNGTAGSTGDGTLATTAEIDVPESVVADAQGNLYLATVGSGNGYIRKVNAAGIISTVAFNGTYGNTGDGGPALASAALENAAQGLSMDPFGNLMLADSANNRVRKLSLNTAFPATQVSQRSAAQSLVLIPTAATTLTADGIATGFGNFTTSALTGCTLGTSAAAGALCVVPVTFAPLLPGDLTAPVVITDSTSATYVTGVTGLGLSPRISFSPAAIATFVGTGTPGYLGDGAAATSARISAPRGGVFDSAGNLYFADSANNVVRKVSAATGFVSTVAGNGALGFGGDGGLATSAMLSGPTFVVVDSAGDLLIADTGNNRVREVNATTGVISTVAGGLTAGYSGDGGLGTSALLNGPTGMMYDSLGNLYIADTGNNAVRRLLPTGVISTFAGTGTAGDSGDGAFAGAATLRAPQGVTADDAGNVYIADTGNNVVRMVNPALNIATFAGVQTLTSNSGDGGPASVAGLKSPTDVTVDPAGEVYIMASNVVRVVNATGKISSIAGSGLTGSYSGDGASAPAAVLATPADNLMMDASGNVYVSDTAANLILKVSSRTAPTLSFADTVVAASSASQVVTVTNTGNQPLTFTADVTSAQFSQASSSCTAATVLAVGTSCTVNATFSPTSPGAQTGAITLTDNSLNLATSQQSINLTGTGLAIIGTTPQTITFGALPNVTYGAAPVTLTATSSSGLAVTYTVTGTAPVSLVGSTLVINGTGTVSVTASQGGNATYAAATPVTQTFTVSRSTLTYTATSFTQPVNTAIPALTYTVTGLVNNDPMSVVTGAPVLTTTATQTSPGGTYPIVITQGTLATANYTFAFVNGSITIQPADFTLSATPASITMKAGLVGLVTLTMTPLANYAGTATLSCSPLPANVKCVFLPTTLVGSGGTAVTVGGLNLTTSAGIAANQMPQLGEGDGIALAGLMLGLLGLTRKKKLARLLVVFGMIGLVGLTGCVTQTTNIATTGTTTITVTAADSASNLSHAVTVTLTLQ